MEVFAVTLFVSLLLGGLFAALFFAERSQAGRRSLDQQALLPLDDGAPILKPAPTDLSTPDSTPSRTFTL